MKKKKKVTIILIILLIIIIISSCVFLYIKYNLLPKQIIITSIDSEYNDNKINITINLKNTIIKEDVYCAITENRQDEKVYEKSHNNKCEFTLDKKEYYIYIKNKNNDIKEYKLTDFVSKVLSLNSRMELMFLAENETLKTDVVIDKIDDTKIDINYSILNEEYATVDKNGVVRGIKDGKTKLVVAAGNKKVEIPVYVTNLITPAHIDNQRPLLSCERYTNEEAKELDEALSGKVKSKGYQTRAGVVEAARFLSLEFPYRINYFLENGRLYRSPIGNADGEGRYYKQGLYLSKEKYQYITDKKTGPAMWGCPLYNLNFSQYRSNGLDCSGFVSWTIINGGFDIGDMAAGGFAPDGIPDLTTIGQKETITKDLLTSKQVKAGDLASVAGHIAIIIGIDDNNVYIAEELYYNKGVQVLTFTYDELVRTPDFTHIILMDEVYKTDGIYTNMWN